MNSTIVGILAAILLIVGASAATAAARIEIVGGETVDLGTGRPGRYEREILITNAGDETLRLLAIESGCGCLVGEPDRRAIEPGDTARMQLVAETSGQVADAWRRTLTITSNDPRRSSVDLLVTAAFRHDVRLGTLINTVWRQKCSECVWTIELENIGDSAITIGTPIVEDLRGVEIAYDMPKARTLAPGEILEVHVAIKIVGREEDFPSVRLMFVSSSIWDPETHVSWFYAPE